MTADPPDLAGLVDSADEAAVLLRILANDKRLLVLCTLLSSGERTVGELETVSGLSQSALSQHLARMRRHGVVKTRRSAQSIYYSIASSETVKILRLLGDLYRLPVRAAAGAR